MAGLGRKFMHGNVLIMKRENNRFSAISFQYITIHKLLADFNSWRWETASAPARIVDCV